MESNTMAPYNPELGMLYTTEASQYHWRCNRHDCDADYSADEVARITEHTLRAHVGEDECANTYPVEVCDILQGSVYKNKEGQMRWRCIFPSCSTDYNITQEELIMAHVAHRVPPSSNDVSLKLHDMRADAAFTPSRTAREKESPTGEEPQHELLPRYSYGSQYKTEQGEGCWVCEVQNCGEKYLTRHPRRIQAHLLGDHDIKILHPSPKRYRYNDHDREVVNPAPAGSTPSRMRQPFPKMSDQDYRNLPTRHEYGRTRKLPDSQLRWRCQVASCGSSLNDHNPLRIRDHLWNKHGILTTHLIPKGPRDWVFDGKYGSQFSNIFDEDRWQCASCSATFSVAKQRDIQRHLREDHGSLTTTVAGDGPVGVVASDWTDRNVEGSDVQTNHVPDSDVLERVVAVQPQQGNNTRPQLPVLYTTPEEVTAWMGSRKC